MILRAVSRGVATTIYVTIVAYSLAIVIGLLVGLMRVSHSRSAREISTFYVEILRAVPMLVILYYIAFVGAPGITQGINALGAALANVAPLAGAGRLLMAFQVRNFDFTTRAIVALTIGYSAFIAEIFRARHPVDRPRPDGGGAIARHELLAGHAVGRAAASGPHGASAAGQRLYRDVEGFFAGVGARRAGYHAIGKVYSASTFRFFETYNVVAFLYLVMTVGLALLVRWLERRLKIAT